MSSSWYDLKSKLWLILLCLACAAMRVQAEEFPGIEECYYQGGILEDADISDANVARYQKLPGVKKIFIKNGALAVELDQPQLDESLIKMGGGLNYEMVEKLPRPPRQYFISVREGSAEGDFESLTKSFAGINTQTRRGVILPHSLVISRRKKAPQPGEHPLSYTRDLDVSPEHVLKLKDDPDLAAIDEGQARYVVYERVEMWSVYDNVKARIALLEKRLVPSSITGMEFKRAHVFPDYWDKSIQRIQAMNEMHTQEVELLIPKEKVDEHQFWSEIIRWNWHTQAEGKQTVLSCDTKAQYPKTCLQWVSNDGVVVRIHWNSGQPRPEALLKAYLEKYPSTLAEKITQDRAQWIYDDVLLLAKRLRAIVEKERPNLDPSFMPRFDDSISACPARLPFLYDLFDQARDRAGLHMACDAMDAWIKTIKPADFTWRPESGDFIFQQEGYRNATLIPINRPDPAIENRIADIRPIKATLLWEKSFPESIPVAHYDDPRMFGNEDRIFQFNQQNEKPRLLALNSRTGVQEEAIDLAGGNLEYVWQDGERLQFKVRDKNYSGHHSTVDMKTLKTESADTHFSKPPLNVNLYYSLSQIQGLDRQEIQLSPARDSLFMVVANSNRPNRAFDAGSLYAMNRFSPGVRWRIQGTKEFTIMNSIHEGHGVTVLEVFPEKAEERFYAAFGTQSGKPLWSLPQLGSCVGVQEKYVLFWNRNLIATAVEPRTGRILTRIALPENPGDENDFLLCKEHFVYASQMSTLQKLGYAFRAVAVPTGARAVDIFNANLPTPYPSENVVAAWKTVKEKVSPATQAKLQILLEKDSKLRQQEMNPIFDIAEHNSQELIPALPLLSAAMLEDPNPTVRAYCLMIFKYMQANAKTARPAIVKATEDEDGNVRGHAIHALVAIGLDDTDIELLKNIIFREKDYQGKETAASALGSAGARALPAVKLLIQSTELSTRTASIYALLNLKAEAAPLVPVIVDVLKAWPRIDGKITDDYVLLHFLEVLKQLGPGASDSIPALIEFLGSENSRLRSASVQALEKMGVKAGPARDALKELLKDSDPAIAATAARTLKVIDPTAQIDVPAVEVPEDPDARKPSLIKDEIQIEITATDFCSPEKVYELYCRALKAGDLRAASACLADDAKGYFEKGCSRYDINDFHEALKIAGAVKPGKLLRKLSSPDGSRVILVFEEEGSLLGVVCRRPLDLRHWIISSFQGDWHRNPLEDPTPSWGRVGFGFERQQLGAQTLGLARIYGLEPGATVRWYLPREFEDNEVTVRLPLLTLIKADSLLDDKTERLVTSNIIQLKAQGTVALLLRKQDENKNVRLLIRVQDPKTGKTIWEKPWPGAEPEEIAFALGAAGLFESDGDLLAVPQEGKEAGTRRYDAKTGELKDIKASFETPTDRAGFSRVGILPDGREIWQSSAKGTEEKLQGIQDRTEAAKILDKKLHIGKPKDPKIVDVSLQSLKPEKEEGQVELVGLSPEGLLIVACVHPDDSITVFARSIGEKEIRWVKVLGAPLLKLKLLDTRLLLQYGKVVTTRQPVMVSLAYSEGLEMLSTKDGKAEYQLKAEGVASKLPQAAYFLQRVGDVDLYRGVVGEKETQVWFGIDAKTGKLAWQSTAAGMDSIVEVDEKSGQVYAINDYGSGIVFDSKTGMQSAMMRMEGFAQRDQLSFIGGTWLVGDSKVKVTETLMTARPPSIGVWVQPEEIKRARQNTPLHIAVEKGELARVKELLGLHPEWVNIEDPVGMTPLYGAVLNGNLELTETLLNHKANIDAINRFSGRTVLSVAAEGVTKESIAMMSMLLDHQKNLAPAVFSELLIHTIREGRFEMVDLLIKRGAPLQATDERGTTPLHVAIWEGRMKVVERLLAEKADPNAKMKDGETPLKAARERKNKEIEELLIKYGAKE